jgi:tRNA(fMet)-specific endonuclease VapC
MAGEFLLDTNAVIAIFAGAPAIGQVIEENYCHLSIIVVGELLYGAAGSAKRRQNELNIQEFCARVVVLDCDLETARFYGEIKHDLRLRGTPIPENDIWIAATAVQHDLALVSRDLYFDHIERVDRIAW